MNGDETELWWKIKPHTLKFCWEIVEYSKIMKEKNENGLSVELTIVDWLVR